MIGEKDELNQAQREALDIIMSGANVFITGSGGTGKTHLLMHVVNELISSGKNVLLTAPTGRAALSIGGITCHRAFRIPVDMTWMCSPSIGRYDPVFHSDVVIIDEISMLRLDAFDYICRSIDKVNAIRASGKSIRTGPVQIIVCGDFLQLPPVMRNEDGFSEHQILSEHYGFDVGSGFAFKSPSWERCGFVTCSLTESERQKNGKDIMVLDSIRVGEREHLAELRSLTRKKKFPLSSQVVKLCGRLDKVREFNDAALRRLPGKAESYTACIKGDVTGSDMPVPQEISLKVGARVMMAVNTDEYVNGSMATIVSLHDDYVEVIVDGNENAIAVSPYTWKIQQYVIKTDDPDRNALCKETVGAYTQLPLMPAYAMTIHKAQGHTLEKAEVVIGQNGSQVFSPGQLYVALSRVKELKNIYINGDIVMVNKLASHEALEYMKGT